MRARRSPRVAMTVDVMFATPTSATRSHVRDLAHRDRAGFPRPPHDDDRRWKCRRPASPPSRPSRGPRSALRSARTAWLAAFSSRGACGCNSSKRASAASRSASSKSSNRETRSPSNAKRATSRHSKAKPSCEVPATTSVTTTPRLPSRCTASRCPLIFGATSWVAPMYAVTSPGANAIPERWSMFTQSAVVAGTSCRLYAAWTFVMAVHMCAWAAASPARYRASSSSKAASRSSGSNHDLCRDAPVGVDFGDDELLGDELPVPSIAVRVTHASEGEALPADRDNG